MTRTTCITVRYLPNLAHIAHLHRVDTAILLDLAPFPDRNRLAFVNRNRILHTSDSNGVWLTVPVYRQRGQAVRDIQISPTPPSWARKHISTLSHTYPQHRDVAPGFLDDLSDCLHSHNGSLLDVCYRSLDLILDYLGCHSVHIAWQSDLTSFHSKDHRLHLTELCRASDYVAGPYEWDLLHADGTDRLFADHGLGLVRTPQVSQEDVSLIRNNSVVAMICSLGREATQEQLARLLSPSAPQVRPKHSVSFSDQPLHDSASK